MNDASNDIQASDVGQQRAQEVVVAFNVAGDQDSLQSGLNTDEQGEQQQQLQSVQNHPRADEEANHVSGASADSNAAGHHGEFQAGDVEELVHGRRNVHTDASATAVEHSAGAPQILAGDVEVLMHGAADVHEGVGASSSVLEADVPKGEFQAGDAEEIVHGARHVHDGNSNAASVPYGPADVEEIVHGSAALHNVHDPAARHEAARTVASAVDMEALMGSSGSDSRRKGSGGVPSVMDGEHMLHGAGGHDHDLRQLQFIKSRDEQEEENKKRRQAKDPFENVHSLLMHGDRHGDEDDDAKVRRGKEITYKDIMDLRLDESLLKGVDLKQLLQKNVREYDDWQRDKTSFKGEVPEGSWWEQIQDLRRRYLSGSTDNKPQDLTGTRLDPESQKWVAGKGVGDEEDAEQDEDDILHRLEILGSTAPLKDRHKQAKDKLIENGRDLTDL